MFRHFPEMDLILSIGLNMKSVKPLYLVVEKIVHDERKTKKLIFFKKMQRFFSHFNRIYFFRNTISTGKNAGVIVLYWRIKEKCFVKNTKIIAGYLVLNQSMLFRFVAYLMAITIHPIGFYHGMSHLIRKI